ncbi:MAG: sulfite exporter TauE/SafE family protein [Bacteroidales bacterium]|jgi:nickel/cobalt exporter|nr:sulfite exporter TauE/SafE family protein [Bacteroidales bacterium]
MQLDSSVLYLTAASIGFFHTLLGPDHYLPFIVISKARKWSILKTNIITFLCGIGHVGSSIAIGFIGILLGIAVNKLTPIEATRGSVAAWLMIAFGLVYFIWGVRKAVKQKEHTHDHMHSDGTVHVHKHSHFREHSHIHEKKSIKELTPWILFTIFIFGPCEPFIPILLYPAAQNNIMDIVMVTLIFSSVTIGTMMLVVSTSLLGIKLLPKINLERFMHAIAGATIFLCGIGIKFLGL